MAPPRAPVVLLVGLLWLPLAGAAGPRLVVTGELGPELDTNANRVQPIVVRRTSPLDDPVTAALLRVTAGTRLSWRLSARHLLVAGYGGGGKLFLSEEARPADELVHEGSLGWAVVLPDATLLAEGSFYDGYQRASDRDFRTGTGLLRLTIGQRAGALEGSLAVGYRGFEYKPAEEFDFHGGVGGLELGSTLLSGPEDERVEWNLALSYWVGQRRFRGPAWLLVVCTNDPSLQCYERSAGARQDLNHVARAEVSYLGNADVTLWYAVEINHSNSHAEAFVRHTVGLKFVTRLVWGVFLTAKGAIQISRFEDPQAVSASFLAVEDENRSRLSVALSRDLTPLLSLQLRYTVYVNESATLVDLPYEVEVPAYLRHTLFAGLRVEYDR